MDIFRKNKKKQQAVPVAAIHEAPVVTSSFTDQLDLIAISAAEMESDASFFDVEEAFSQEKKIKSNKSGIDALIDSDEDGAEIFNDLEESSDEGIDDTNNGQHDSPSSKRSTVSRHSVPSPTAKFKVVVKSIDASAVEQSKARVTSKNGDSSGVVEMEKVDDDDDDSASSREEEEEKSNSDSAEDYTDDEDEGEDGYKPGGYHPVKPGEIYNQRYERAFGYETVRIQILFAIY